ncbi:MAG: DMT family transporter, partial [Muribaculaceae bacterium]|nr:DMT family transporter [Muribaculaceae bacterium]
TDWILLSALALLPTVVSLTCTTKAIHLIGSPPTAIFGALEPLTAVLLSVVVLHQSLTPREMLGGLLIIISTTLVIASDPIKDFCRRGLRRVSGNK